MENELKENGLMVKGFDEIQKQSETKKECFTTIQDAKKIFNLENHVDVLLNDCVGNEIAVKDVMIKKYTKKMKEPIVDEETGEIIKENEFTYATILIDENGTSYATGSKIFARNMMTYMQMFGIGEGFKIRIVKNAVKNSANKSLGFELL